jgi:Pvc16 N-terminal domain/Carboxypeptidase regulatory-like domain
MFQDLDETLRRLLDDPAMADPSMNPPLKELLNADKSFQTPDKNFAPPQATVNLFLYDVKENRTLRNPAPIFERQNGFYVRQVPPLRTDCTYLVTAWSSQTGAAKVIEEHRLLAETLVWLTRFPTIPASYLFGIMVNQPFPIPTQVAQMEEDENAGQFWSALGIAPRSTFSLRVTVALDLQVQSEGALMTTAIANYQQDANAATAEEWINIGGVVRDNTGQPVQGAWVRLEPARLVQYTDANGGFIFARIRRANNYTLRVVAQGLGEITRTVDVPSPSGEYNLQFP